MALVQGGEVLKERSYLPPDFLARKGLRVVDFGFSPYDGVVLQHHFEQVHSPEDPMQGNLEKIMLVRISRSVMQQLKVSPSAAAAFVGTTPHIIGQHVAELPIWLDTQHPDVVEEAVTAATLGLRAAADALSLRAFEALCETPGITGILGVVGLRMHEGFLARDRPPSTAAGLALPQILGLMNTREFDRAMARREQAFHEAK